MSIWNYYADDPDNQSPPPGESSGDEGGPGPAPGGGTVPTHIPGPDNSHVGERPSPDGGSGDGSGGFDPSGFPGFINAPRFVPPVFSYGHFTPPDPNSILNDPSFKFRLGQGTGAIQNSAAGQGILRSGGSLKALNDYAQNFASQEYSNIYNRDQNTFMTNYGVARDVFDRNYTGAKDAFAPLLAEWQARLADNWNKYLFGNISATDQAKILATQTGAGA